MNRLNFVDLYTFNGNLAIISKPVVITENNKGKPIIECGIQDPLRIKAFFCLATDGNEKFILKFYKEAYYQFSDLILNHNTGYPKYWFNIVNKIDSIHITETEKISPELEDFNEDFNEFDAYAYYGEEFLKKVRMHEALK